MYNYKYIGSYDNIRGEMTHFRKKWHIIGRYDTFQEKMTHFRKKWHVLWHHHKVISFCHDANASDFVNLESFILKMCHFLLHWIMLIKVVEVLVVITRCDNRVNQQCWCNPNDFVNIVQVILLTLSHLFLKFVITSRHDSCDMYDDDDRSHKDAGKAVMTQNTTMTHKCVISPSFVSFRRFFYRCVISSYFVSKEREREMQIYVYINRC